MWYSYAPVNCCWSQLLLNAGEFPTKNTHTYQDNGFGDDVVWSVDVPKRDVISVLFRRVRGCFELLSLSGLPYVDAWRLVDVTLDSSAYRRYRRNWVKYLLSAPANSVAHSTSVVTTRCVGASLRVLLTEAKCYDVIYRCTSSLVGTWTPGCIGHALLAWIE